MCFRKLPGSHRHGGSTQRPQTRRTYPKAPFFASFPRARSPAAAGGAEGLASILGNSSTNNGNRTCSNFCVDLWGSLGEASYTFPVSRSLRDTPKKPSLPSSTSSMPRASQKGSRAHHVGSHPARIGLDHRSTISWSTSASDPVPPLTQCTSAVQSSRSGRQGFPIARFCDGNEVVSGRSNLASRADNLKDRCRPCVGPPGQRGGSLSDDKQAQPARVRRNEQLLLGPAYRFTGVGVTA